MEGLKISDLLVMLVEPSLPQGKLISMRLEDTGVGAVIWERDGHSALQTLTSQRPDLMISAMHLPDMTATDLLHQIRNDPQLGNLPFMLISSETSFESLDPIRQAGVIAILPKPFEPTELRRALHTTLDHLVPDEELLADIDLNEVRALVVDDSSMARKYIARVLQDIGIESITEAGDGSEAITLIEQDFFDLLVTDYNMPEVDGHALVRFVREQSNQASLPIMMVTSEQDESRLSAVRQAGTSAICDKPFETGAVRQLILQMLSDA